jgi:hypothetical protein
MVTQTAAQRVPGAAQAMSSFSDKLPDNPGGDMLRSLIFGSASGLPGFGSFTDRTRKAQLGTTVKAPSVPSANLGVIVPDPTRQLQ